MRKTVLITGASRGIGKAIALKFAKEGYNLAICSGHSHEALSETAEEIRLLGAECLSTTVDVSDYIQLENFINSARQRFGRIDIVVNNAGISHIGLLQDMTIEEWNRIVNINLTSVFSACKLSILDMISGKNGSIVNISSMWGVCGASCEVAYSATKGGINAFTKALAKELAPSGINVNAIACGVIDTTMNSCFTEEERQALTDEIPVGRMGTPDEVAELAFSLAVGSKYLTGQVIALDGGYM